MGKASLRSRWERAFRQAEIAKGQYGVSTVAIGMTLATYASPDGTRVFPSQETVAKGLGVGPRTVSRAMTRLVAEGWLTVTVERKPPYRMVTQYRLSIPAEWDDTTAEASSLTDEVSVGDGEAPSSRQESPLTNTETTTAVTTTESPTHPTMAGLPTHEEQKARRLR